MTLSYLRSLNRSYNTFVVILVRFTCVTELCKKRKLARFSCQYIYYIICRYTLYDYIYIHSKIQILLLIEYYYNNSIIIIGATVIIDNN